MLRWNTDVTEQQLAGPIVRTNWDDSKFDQHPLEECEMPIVELTGIAGHNALACGARPMISPFWGKGTGALDGGRMLGRTHLLDGLMAVNGVLEKMFDLELFLVEAFRSAKMQASGFADVFWRPDGVPKNPEDAVHAMSIEQFLKRSYAARNGYLENGVVLDGLYDSSMAFLEKRRGTEFAQVAQTLGKSPSTVAHWTLKYYANLLGTGYAQLDVAGNRPHGTGAVVDAVLRRKSTGQVVCMGSPSDDTGSLLPDLDFFETHSYGEFLTELEADPVSTKFLADFAEQYGTDRPTMHHYEDAKRYRRILANSMFLILGAGGYSAGPKKSEFWHFCVPKTTTGPGDPTWMVMAQQKIAAIFGSRFAHASAAQIVGTKYVY